MLDTAHLIVNPANRWELPFDADFSGADVDRVLALAPFKDMDPKRFPQRMPLRTILGTHSRLRHFRADEIIVRAGDYGTSAFMVISGAPRVVVAPDLPLEALGRSEPERKTLWQALAQLWRNPRYPEVRLRARVKDSTFVSTQAVGGDKTRVFLQDVPRIIDDHQTVAMQPGDFFGEIAALSRMPRTATIFAEGGDVELLEIRWQGLRDLMKYDDALRRHIDDIYRTNALSSHLRSIPIFSGLNDEQLKRVMAQTQFRTYGEYDWSGDYKRLARTGELRPETETVIAQEGDYPNGVILIRSGFARVSRRFGHGHRTLNYLGAGRHYGLREIAHNWRERGDAVPLQYTLRVVGYTHTLFIPTAVMEENVFPTVPGGELPALFTEEELASEPETSRTPGGLDAGAKIGPELMEFLTENRFFNGTAAMVIDLDHCTRCDDCVRACAEAHDNNPRFLRQGPSSGRIMVANACMHCADPVCMIGCPTGAIHRESFGGQVIINPDTCVGCRACANNCPYEAIRMVEVRDDEGAFMVGPDFKPILKATKCDYCVDQLGGPACERACPHGALKRLNMGDLDYFAKWLRR